MTMKRKSIISLSLVSMACMTAMAHGAVSVPATGITVDFAAAPAGADFASVSVAAAAGDVTSVDALDADVTNSLAWPATATNWTANSIAVEPTASALNSQIRYAVNTARILTGPTGNKYSAFIGRFTNNAGASIESFGLTWAEGIAVASSGTGAVGTDPIAGLSVYYSRTGTTGSWVKVDGPHATDGDVGPTTITPASSISSNSDFYIAWVDDNGPGSTGSEGNYTIDNVTISDIATASSSITATVTNVTRSPGPDAADPNDDLIGFTLSVSRTGNAGTTWTISDVNLGNTGDYTEPKVYTGLDIALFAAQPHTLTGTVTDDSSGAKSEFSVTAPWASLTASANTFAVVAGNKFTANLNVAGTYLSTRWLINNPGTVFGLPADGDYGVDVATSEIDIPILPGGSATPVAQLGPFTVGDSLYLDAITPDLYLLPAMVIGRSTVPGKPADIVSNGRLISGDATNQITWGYDPSGPSLQMTDGDANGAGAAAKRISATYSLTDVVGPVQFSMKMIATDGSSGFEAPDTFAARLIYSDGGQELPPVNLVTAAHEAQAGFAGVVDGILSDDEIVSANTSNTFDFTALIPDDIQSVRIEIEAITDSTYTSERMVVQDILIAGPPTGIQVTNLTNVLRLENGPGSEDDAITFTAEVTGINASATWTSSSAITPNAGDYGTVSFTIPAPLTASPMIITFVDGTDPTLTGSVFVQFPGRAVIGQRDFGGGLTDVNNSLATASSARWVNDSAARTHTISTGVAAQPEVVLSEVLDLSAVGSVRFSATVTANDTSSGSNYEPTDRLKLELIIDGGLATESTVPLVGPYDVGDGASAVPFAMGAPLPNGAPDGWINGYNGTASTADGFAAAVDEYLAHIVRDEFNLNAQAAAESMTADLTFSHIVPEGASSVQLRLTSEGIQGTESVVLKDVLFTLSTGPVDSDSDGMYDDYEVANGLLPNNASDKLLDKDGDGQSNFNEFLAGTLAGDSTSTLKITNIVSGAPGTVNVTVASVAGKRYRLQESMDLGNGDTWADAAAPVQTATGAATSFNGVPVPFNGSASHFMRAKVVP